MSNTKELREIPGLKKEDVVIIKKFNYGEVAELGEKAARIEVVRNKQMNVGVNIAAYKVFTLVYGISNAPFFSTGCDKEQLIKNLEKETGEYIFKEITKFNEMDDAEKLEELKKK